VELQLAVGVVFGIAEVHRRHLDPGPAQAAELLCGCQLFQPAPALGRCQATFGRAQKIIRFSQRLDTSADRDLARRTGFRPAQRVPEGAIMKYAGPGIEAARDQ